MTHTPEKRAMRVTDAILDLVMVDGENVSASVLHPATDLIALAIREAEDAALERAAVVVQTRISMPAASFKCAGETLRDQNGDEYFLGARTVNELIERKASNIRSLKHNKD